VKHLCRKTSDYDKLQGSVRPGGVVNNHIRKRLLLGLLVNFFNPLIFWQSYKQERDCVVHFLRLLAAHWPGAQTARDNILQLSQIFTDFNFFTGKLGSNLFGVSTK